MVTPSVKETISPSTVLVSAKFKVAVFPEAIIVVPLMVTPGTGFCDIVPFPVIAIVQLPAVVLVANTV